MPTAPAAEFPQLYAIRIVAPALVGLVVAPLALLAGKRHRDSNFSASHLSVDEGLQRPGPGCPKKNTAPPRARLA
jgi:hypothetical protein